MRTTIWICFIGVLATGCSLALGKRYTGFDPVPGGMAAVYIYDGEATALQHVHVDRTPDSADVTATISMVKGGYFPYLTAPGTLRILAGPSESPTCISLVLAPNTQHYVRVTSGPPYVFAMTAADGEAEIAEKREISTDAREAGVRPFPPSTCPAAM